LKNTYHISRKIARSVFIPAYPSCNKLKTLGDHILKRRIDLWLEQKEVAEIIGVDKCTIANWEKNRNAPRIRHLPKIIDFLCYQPWDEGCRSLGERIIKERQIMGLSQKQLAIQIGIDPCTIRSWEKGKHKPNRHSLQKLGQFFTNGGSVQKVRRDFPNRF
jgi:transcriptional regulator with XRE-family HTH domain